MNPIDPAARAIRSFDDSPQAAKLRKATRGVEALFVSTLLRKMHAAAAQGGMMGQGSESSTYREMLDDALANEISKRGALGIADTLYKRMTPLVKAETEQE